LTLLLNNKLTK